MERSNTPFFMEFGTTVAEKRGDWFYCEDKDVKVHIPTMLKHAKELNSAPLNTKFLIGCKISNSNEPVHMWRDELKSHIGCMEEDNVAFSKKYVKLVKQING